MKARDWTRHLVQRKVVTRTTWKAKAGLLACAVLALWLTRGSWTSAIARSLVCEEDVAPSDAILVENFDPDYLLFERAALLRKAGVADRIVVPTRADPGTNEPNAVALGTVEVMARIARLGQIEAVPIPEFEPISLNAAYRVREFFERAHIRSVIVVTPLYRSQRSALVYGATLGAGGIAVRCVPVRRGSPPDPWTGSWHGIEDVAQQWIKLQYYRFYVLPFVHRAHVAPGRGARLRSRFDFATPNTPSECQAGTNRGIDDGRMMALFVREDRPHRGGVL